MHAIIKKAALAAALATASLSAHALETKISVYADVDPTLALMRQRSFWRRPLRAMASPPPPPNQDEDQRR